MSPQENPHLVVVDKAFISVIDDGNDHVTLSELPIFHKIVMPKDVTFKASSSFVGFGRELSSLISLPHDLLK